VLFREVDTYFSDFISLVENKEQSLILISAAVMKGTVVRDYWSGFFHDSTPPTHKIQVLRGFL
jgi:hypothetical protein